MKITIIRKLLAATLIASLAFCGSAALAAGGKGNKSKIEMCKKWGPYFLGGCSGVVLWIFDDYVEKTVGWRPLALATIVATSAGGAYLAYKSECEKNAICKKYVDQIEEQRLVLRERISELEGQIEKHNEEFNSIEQEINSLKKVSQRQTEILLAKTTALREKAAELEHWQLELAKAKSANEAFEEQAKQTAEDGANKLAKTERGLAEAEKSLAEAKKEKDLQIESDINKMRHYRDMYLNASKGGKTNKADNYKQKLTAALEAFKEHHPQSHYDLSEFINANKSSNAQLDDATIFGLPELEKTSISLNESIGIFTGVIDASKRAAEKSERLSDLVKELSATNRPAEGMLWGTGYADDIKFAITPEYSDQHRTKLTADHSKSFWQTWQDAIASANSYVDITSLSPPDPGEGGFSDILKQAIVRLALKSNNSKNPIRVRILFATIPSYGGLNQASQKVNTREFLDRLVSEPVEPLSEPVKRVSDYNLEISVGTFDATKGLNLSWNHSKIVAADEHTLFTGGHNLYNSYLFKDEMRPEIKASYSDPVHDVSVLLKGQGVALTAHRFIDRLWKYVIDNKSREAHVWRKAHKIQECSSSKDCYLPTFESGAPPALRSKDAHRFISVGRLGNIDPKENERNVSDVAIISLIRNTKKAVFISQQKMMPIYVKLWGQVTHRFNDLVFAELANLINSGKDVFILTSSNLKDASGEGVMGYQSGSTPREISAKFVELVLNQHVVQVKAAAELQVAKYLHFLPTANGNNEVPNHAKVVISDADCAYIGSSNVYDDSHQEFGVIIGREKTIELIKKYFMPFWISSLEHWERRGRVLNEP